MSSASPTSRTGGLDQLYWQEWPVRADGPETKRDVALVVDHAATRGTAVTAGDAEAAEPAEHQERADADGCGIEETGHVRADHQAGRNGCRDGTRDGLIEHDPFAAFERGRDGRDRQESKRRREYRHEAFTE